MDNAMKRLVFVLMTMFMLSLGSCGTLEYTDDYGYVSEYSSSYDVNIILTYGTPYYYNGYLWYILYNDLYYYPFYYNHYWYFRPYPRIYPYGYDFRFRPHHNDYRFRPHHRDWNHQGHLNPGHRPHNNHGYNHNPGRKPDYPRSEGTINNGRPRPDHPRGGNVTPSRPSRVSSGSSRPSGRSGYSPRPSGPSRSLGSVRDSSMPTRGGVNHGGRRH